MTATFFFGRRSSALISSSENLVAYKASLPSRWRLSRFSSIFCRLSVLSRLWSESVLQAQRRTLRAKDKRTNIPRDPYLLSDLGHRHCCDRPDRPDPVALHVRGRLCRRVGSPVAVRNPPCACGHWALRSVSPAEVLLLLVLSAVEFDWLGCAVEGFASVCHDCLRVVHCDERDSIWRVSGACLHPRNLELSPASTSLLECLGCRAASWVGSLSRLFPPLVSRCLRRPSFKAVEVHQALYSSCLCLTPSSASLRSPKTHSLSHHYRQAIYVILKLPLQIYEKSPPAEEVHFNPLRSTSQLHNLHHGGPSQPICCAPPRACSTAPSTT